MMNMRKTRNVLASGLIGLMSLGGCPQFSRNGFEEPNEPVQTVYPCTEEETGVPRFNTQEEILGNNRVKTYTDGIEQSGTELRLSDGKNPNAFHGTYIISSDDSFLNGQVIRFEQGEKCTGISFPESAEINSLGNCLVFGEQNNLSMYFSTRINSDCIMDFVTVLDGEKKDNSFSGYWIDVPTATYTAECSPRYRFAYVEFERLSD